MRSLHEIFVIVKKSYVNDRKECLCFTVLDLKREKKLTSEEGWEFSKEWHKTRDRKKRFYNRDSEIVDNIQEYGWPIKNRKARERWLSHRIGKFA